MAVPGFQDFMLPILKLLSDGSETSARVLVEKLSHVIKITPDDLVAKLPSGKQTIFENRVAWARFYLKKANLIASPRRGHFLIAEAGKKLLIENPAKIDIALLQRYPSFVEFHDAGAEKVEEKNFSEIHNDETPQELMERAYAKLKTELEGEILRMVKSCSPEYFENVVVQLLVAMGYGGSLADAGKAVGRSGDGGIDGIIKEDKLGLEVIYLQAKRWENVVGRPEIQKFVGALAGQRANKGVFLTTSSFTGEATAYASGVQQKVILVDGRRLVELMIEHDLGVSTVAKFEIKKVDHDFFEEE